MVITLLLMKKLQTGLLIKQASNRLPFFRDILKIRYVDDNSGSDAYVFTDYNISIDKNQI